MNKAHDLDAFDRDKWQVLDALTIQFPKSPEIYDFPAPQWQEYTANTRMEEKYVAIGANYKALDEHGRGRIIHIVRRQQNQT